MTKQKLCVVFLAMIFSVVLFAQKGSEQLLKVVPPSPVVAALGKYGEVPVSLYTGVPDISIPLYEIKEGSLDLPISLSYHAGGIKVEEIASPVGLSWSLNAGGVIGRGVRGVPDDISNWRYRDSANSVEHIMLSGDSHLMEQLASDVDAGIKDGEADIYYYNFNQFAGKFFYDQSGKVHVLPAKNILIDQVDNGWKITGEDGTVYSFNKVEQVNSANCSTEQSVYSAWFLTSIKSIDGKREITFEYDKVSYTYETLIGQTKYFSYDGSNALCITNRPPCLGTQNYNTHRLSKINFSDGYIKFNYNNVRCDLMMDKSLDVIEVYTHNNDLIKRFNLAYSYFGNNINGCNLLTQNSKRLKLVSITEETADIHKPSYSFEYNESVELPGRLSYSQDHWGYFNGKPNMDLIATFTTTLISGQQTTYQGADRSANPQTAQAGILTKIKYPTGGETSFTYESNTVTDNRVASQITERTIHFGAVNQSVSSLGNPFESESLIIPATGAEVHFDVAGLSNNYWWGCDMVHCYVIKDNNATPFAEIGNNWNDISTRWQPGSYKFRLINECGVSSVANFSISIRAQIATLETITVKPVGGLRISQIEDKPNGDGQSIVKRYRYYSENDSTHSSGVLVNFPDYGYDYGVLSSQRGPDGEAVGPPTFCNYRVRQSYSNYPLATTQGSYVGYAHVIVDEGDGESRYSFSAYPDLIDPGFPFAPVENFDWSRGFLLSSKDLILKNGVWVLARETKNIPASFNRFSMYGIKTGRSETEIINGEVIPRIQAKPKYSFYPTITEFFALAQTKEKYYDQNDPSKFIETVTDYTYNPQHLQLAQSKTVTSGGGLTLIEELVSNKKYPFDYNFNGSPAGEEALGIKNLQDLHAVGAVVEEYLVKQKRNAVTNELYDQRIIDGNLTTYKADKPYPDQLFKLNINSSIPLSVFGYGSVLSANSFLKNADPGVNDQYKPMVKFNSYDDYGNITTQQKVGDVMKSYVWGYNSKYPVAEVVGADHDAVIVNSGLDQAIIQNPLTSDEEMRTELDKIRTHFPSALVTTYTYKPMMGISSQTDINNHSMFYEYDSFGRLILVRDQDKNILKKLCYNYKGQIGNCMINVDVINGVNAAISN